MVQRIHLVIFLQYQKSQALQDYWKIPSPLRESSGEKIYSVFLFQLNFLEIQKIYFSLIFYKNGCWYTNFVACLFRTSSNDGLADKGISHPFQKRSGYFPGDRINKTYLPGCYSEPSLTLKRLFNVRKGSD